MNRTNGRLLLVAATMFGLLAGRSAAAANVDDELRQAAKLHKGGDTAAAVAIWQRWAERGDVDAAYNLAVIHQAGDGVVRDYAQALRWYRVAAERDDRTAQYQLGMMYLRGDGVAADAQEAHRWFTLRRAHHAHHADNPQMRTWRKQALALIEERDRREAMLAAKDDGARVLAELRRRAGMAAGQTLAASGKAPLAN